MKKKWFLIVALVVVASMHTTLSHALMNTDSKQDVLIQKLLSETDTPTPVSDNQNQETDFSVPESDEGQAPRVEDSDTEIIPEEIDPEEGMEGGLLGGGEGFLDGPGGSGDGPGSQSISINVDPHTGSASTAFPISVIPGRAGIQPNISLTYNSSQRNGVVGMGWSLSLGTISRSTKFGTPKYDSSDTFVLTQSGAVQELVYDNSAGFYRTQTEGAFMKTDHVSSGNYWMVTDRQGIKYYFGENQSSQEYDPTNSGHVSRWYLSKVEDIHGNYMTFEYFRDNNQLYIQRIQYTGNSQQSLSPYAKVEFEYESRSDEQSNCTLGYCSKTTKRLKRVSVYAENNLQRKVDLNYQMAGNTHRSILTEVVQYGSDGTSALPATTFSYQNQSVEIIPSFNVVSRTLPPPGGVDLWNLHGFSADFDSDGMADAAIFNSEDGKIDVSLSNGDNFLSASTWISNFGQVGDRIQLGDFDGDSRVDVVLFRKNAGDWIVALNNGSGFTASASPWITNFAKDYGEVSSGDFNGDGLTDIVGFYETTGGKKARIAINQGGQFQYTSGSDPIAVDYNDYAPFVADFNSDGLADFGGYKQNTGDWKIRLNKGGPQKATELIASINGFGTSFRMVVADFNSDGLPDVGYYHTVYGNIIYKAFNGKSFASQRGSGIVFNLRSDNTWIQSSDYNGDGIMDFTAYENAVTTEIARSDGDVYDLLSKVTNGVGGKTEIEYDSSVNCNNQFLPFVIPVVKSVTTGNSLGDAYTTHYDYEGALWKADKREFRGFQKVKIIDVDGNYAFTEFLQDDIYKGRPQRQASYDAQDNLYSKAENTWDYETIVTDVEFPYLKRVDNFVYDGDATGRRTAQEFEYGETTQYGNLTKTIQLGEVNLNDGVDIGTDKRTVETEYHNVDTSSLRLLGFPKHVTVKDDQSAVVRQEWLYYDDSTNYQTLPTQGFLTQKESWAGGTPSVNPVVEYDYDVYGNLKSTKDALDNPTTIEYDTALKMFPLKTKNALNQEVVNEYYGVNGVSLCEGGYCGLWGQLKSTKDPNNQTGTKIYDVFGRPIKTISPLDSLALPTTEVEYETNSTYTKVTTRQRIENGQPQMIEAVQYSDGLGRLIQAKAKSGVEGQYVVSGQTEYNSRGLSEKKYLPYFTTNPMGTIDPINTNNPYTTIEYDDMGRAVKSINPDGSYSTVEYDDWATTTIDENGHKQKSYFDSYGRLVKKEEYEGADGRGAPIYSASSFNLYATTQYEYDSEGNLTKVIDDHNNVTHIAYDELGRKKSMTDPDMGYWEYEYDLNGNLKKQTDAKNQNLEFDYDVLNRLENKTDNSAIDVDYTYDDQQVNNSIGRLTKAQYSWLDKTDFAYDILGRETASTKAIGQHQYTVEREYDALSRLTKIEYPDNAEVYYHYNDAGQVIRVSDGDIQYEEMSEPFAHYKFNDIVDNVVEDDGSGNNSGVFYGSTKLLLPFEGPNGSQQTVDIAGNHAVNFFGNAQLTTSVKKFGDSSLDLDGSGDYLRMADSSDWDIAGSTNGSWSMDFWVKLENPQSDDQVFAFQYEGNGDRWWFGQQYYSSNSYLRFFMFSGGGAPVINFQTTTTGINDTNWHHLVLVRKGNEYGIYLDGAQVAYTSDNDTDALSGNLYYGAQLYDNNVNTTLNGNMDDFRVSNSNSFSASPNSGKTDTISVPQNPHELTAVGKIDRAVGFNGTSDYVQLNNLADDIKTDSTGSIAFWTKADSLTDVIAGIGDGTLNNQLGIQFNSGYLSASLISGGVSQWEVKSDASLSSGVWYYVVLTHDGTTATLNINGAPHANWQTTTNKTKWLFDINPNVAYIGRRANGDLYYEGKVDDFRYYRDSLTAQEIQALYNNGAGTEESRPSINSGGQQENEVYVQDVEYNAAGQITHIWYGNETHTIYEYDDDTLRLERIFTQFGTIQTLQDLNYAYDNVGNIVAIVDAVNTGSQTFKYDEFNRLVEARGKYGQSQIQTKTYVYNEIGNIIQKDGLTYTYSKQNAGPHAVTSLSDGSQFAYDLNGNMTYMVRNGVNTIYAYDSENRLKEVRKGGIIIASYEYDGDGGRTQKTIHDAGGSVTTTYVGSLFEKTGNIQTKYIYLGDTRVCAIAQDPGGTKVRYYHGDHLGSANVITDSDGYRKELIEYMPFGQFARREMYGQSQEVAWFYFTGKPYDDETGLYYYGARYYDPSLGRFITPDRMVVHPNDPQDLNRYAYCRNNPTNLIDPTGNGWLKNIFKSLNKIFDKFVGWLENVTNSKWSIEAEFGQSHQFQDFQTLGQGTGQVIGETATHPWSLPWNMGVGIYRWASESRYGILKSNSGNNSYTRSSIEDGDNLFINGILNTYWDAFDNGKKVYKQNAFKVAYNPTDGVVADITESFLQKLTFTSSFSRQLARDLSGHKGVTLAGHSQGGIIAGNTLLNLGIRDQRNVIEQAVFRNTQISRTRANLSGAMAGLNSKHVFYGSRYFDPSNVGGPNLSEPLKFLSGIPGLYLPFGVEHHGIQ